MRKAMSLSLSETFNPLNEYSDELRGHTMNLESDELVCVQPLQVFGFDVPREFQADIVNGHRPLFVAVDPFESERFHLLCVLRVRHEMKQPAPSPPCRNPSHSNFPASRAIAK